jgi:hypothetical protein
MGVGKYLLYAAAAPVTVPAVSLVSAFQSAKQRNLMSVAANCFTAWAMLTGGNHFIANPQENVADSVNQIFHPEVSLVASDAAKATQKWTGGAITGAKYTWAFISGAGSGFANGVDEQIQSNRSSQSLRSAQQNRVPK